MLIIKKTKGGDEKMGVASLVLGIISLVLCFIPGTSLIGLILSLIGVILGAMGRKVPEKAGIATGGMVCSIIALVLCGIWFFACGGTAMLAACLA